MLCTMFSVGLISPFINWEYFENLLGRKIPFWREGMYSEAVRKRGKKGKGTIHSLWLSL